METKERIVNLEEAQEMGYSSARFHNTLKNFPLGSEAYAGTVDAVRRTIDAVYSVPAEEDEPRTVDHVYGIIDRCLMAYSESVPYQHALKELRVQEYEDLLISISERLAEAKAELKAFEEDYNTPRQDPGGLSHGRTIHAH